MKSIAKLKMKKSITEKPSHAFQSDKDNYLREIMMPDGIIKRVLVDGDVASQDNPELNSATQVHIGQKLIVKFTVKILDQYPDTK
jgi:hypothetical protein